MSAEMETTKDVWVVVEQKDGELHEVTLEMLGEGRKLALKLGVTLCAVLMGERVNGLADTLAFYGADRVYLLEDPLLAQYTTDAYTTLLTRLIQERTPAIVLLAATPNGQDLAARLAARLKTGLASDCILLKIDEQGVLQLIRPTYDGKVYTSVVCSVSAPHMATIRPGVIGVDKPDKSRRAQVVRVPVKIDAQSIRTRVTGFIQADPKTVDLSEADIIVAGGRGVGGPENWHVIEELADALGGSVGGSRVAMDLRCIPRERMIGQTGKTIGPKVYIAAGISGASHHVDSIKESKLIIAIDCDRTAPILKLAELGVVGDLHTVIPALTKRLHKVTKSDRSSQAGKGDQA